MIHANRQECTKQAYINSSTQKQNTPSVRPLRGVKLPKFTAFVHHNHSDERKFFFFVSSRGGRDPGPHTPPMYTRLTEAAGGWAPRNRRAQGHQRGGRRPASSAAPASSRHPGPCWQLPSARRPRAGPTVALPTLGPPWHAGLQGPSERGVTHMSHAVSTRQRRMLTDIISHLASRNCAATKTMLRKISRAVLVPGAVQKRV